MSQLNEVLDSKKLICELNNSVNYCHWKSNEHIIPAINGETDLDILTDIKDKEKIRQANSFERLLNLQLLIQSYYGTKQL